MPESEPDAGCRVVGDLIHQSRPEIYVLDGLAAAHVQKAKKKRGGAGFALNIAVYVTYYISVGFLFEIRLVGVTE